MKLAVMTDLHTDLIPGAETRIKTFFQAVEEEGAEFVINLGDFAFPKEENQWIAKLWEHGPAPHCMVLGNHDMDVSDKSTWMQFYGMQRSYDSFDFGGVHFILLDTNYFNFGGVCYDYAYSNYFDKEREFLGEAQRNWLREDLEKAVHPCVLLSHEGLEHTGDKQQVMDILRQFQKKIIVCINGHNHVDGLTIEDGIHFLDVISMSGQWIGETLEPLTEEKEPKMFCKQDYDQYRYLRCTAPYRDALYEFIDIDLEQKTVSISGPGSEFVGKLPKERGHSGMVKGIVQTAQVQSKTFCWGKAGER